VAALVMATAQLNRCTFSTHHDNVAVGNWILNFVLALLLLIINDIVPVSIRTFLYLVFATIN